MEQSEPRVWFALGGRVLCGPSVPEGAMELPAAQAAQMARVQAMGGEVALDRFVADQATAGIKAAVAAQVERRDLRDQLLRETDWTQLADTLPGQAALKADWARYRQELRDMDLTQDVWPLAPGETAE